MHQKPTTQESFTTRINNELNNIKQNVEAISKKIPYESQHFRVQEHYTFLFQGCHHCIIQLHKSVSIHSSPALADDTYKAAEAQLK